MKIRSFSFLLAVVLILSLAACGKSETGTSGMGTTGSGTIPTVSAPTGTTDETGTSLPLDLGNNEPGQGERVPIVPGKLYQLNQKETDAPVISALRLLGNRAGSEEDINVPQMRTESIRCIFELNEWITIYPATAENVTGLAAYLVPHRADFSIYQDTFLAELSEEPAAVQLEPMEEPEENCVVSGEMYLNPENSQPGLYDMVFTKDSVPIAVVMLNFYEEGSMDELDSDDLSGMMDEVISNTIVQQ